MLSNILKKASLILALAVTVSTLNVTDVSAAEKVKYGAAIKDGKLYSLEIREDSVTAVPASKSNPVNDKYGDKYFSQNTYKDFTVFDRYGNATTYDYKSNGGGTSNGIESCKLEDETGNKYLFYQRGGVFSFEYDDSQVGSKNSIIVEKNGKKGLVDNSGKKITDCKYDELYFTWSSSGDYFTATKGGKKGALNSKGIEIIPCEYDEIYKYNALFNVKKGDKTEYISIKKNKKIIYDAAKDFNNVIIVRKNGKLGVINKSGREILKCDYDEIGKKYSDDSLGSFGIYKLTNVKKNGKWGYVDNKGKVKIKLKYDSAETFNGKYARVGKAGDWKFINKKGKEIYKFNYEDMGSFYDGSVCVKKGGKWGIVDKNNKVLVDFIYEDIKHDYDNVAANKDGKWGLIDRKGNVITPFIYEDVDDGSYNFIYVKKDGKWGFIDDESGKEIVSCLYEKLDYCSRKLISVSQGNKWGIVDKNGNVVQECKFDSSLHVGINVYGEGWINTKINGKHGLLDENGREIYPAESEETVYFYEKNNITSVKKNGKYGLINREGREIYPTESEEHIWVDGDVARVKKNGKYGAINKEGRIVYPITADSMGIYGGMVEVSNSINGQGYKSGLFDSNGNEVLPIKYNGIDYQNGVFTVYDRKYGIFNTKGKQILPLEYDKIYIFGSNN